MAVKAGVLSLTVGGVDYNIDPESAKWSVDDQELESVLGARGAIGDSAKGVAPYIEVKVILDEKQKSSDLKKVGDDPVILLTRDRSVTLTEARLTGRLEPDNANGLTVHYEGRSANEVLI